MIAEDGSNATYRCTRCGHTYTSPISIIDPPNPPVSQYSLGDEAATTGCGSERVLKSTVTEEHSYIYAGGRLLRETITTTAANGTVTTKVLDFAYDAQGTPYSLTYTNGTASPATYYYVTNLQGDVTYPKFFQNYPLGLKSSKKGVLFWKSGKIGLAFFAGV